MNDLRKYFEKNPGRLIDKWSGYFEIYERHLARFRGRDMTLLEIGVSHGGSLQMWKHYFGHRAAIYGMDIDPRCKLVEEEQIRVIIGDQGDRRFLESVRSRLPRIDVLIDDGGHRVEQQVATLEVLFGHLVDDGVYICEDLHTNYWPEYGGGLRRGETFIEHAKSLIDQLNAWFTRDAEQFEVDDFTLGAYSMHFYTSVLVIEKRRMGLPGEGRSGVPSW